MIPPDKPESVLDYPGLWVAVMVNPQKWQHVSELIDSRGGMTYTPIVTERRIHGGVSRSVQVPLFREYLFCTLPDFARTYFDPVNIPDVRHLIDINDQPRFRRELRAIQLACDSGRTIDLYPKLLPGKRVRIVQDRMAGVEGQIIRRDGRDLFVLACTFMNSCVMVEDIPGECLEVIE